jgi:CheY-like chemotaxis protein
MANVLVVDDEQAVRSVLRRMLTNLGHKVWEAPDGAEALRVLDAIRFDLAIVDVYLGPVDGMELLIRMQQRGLRPPVVVMSGGGFKASADVLAMARGCGAAATLNKPFTPEQLRQTIEPFLRPHPASQ